MKTIRFMLFIACVLISTPSYAASRVFAYKVAPGQIWKATVASQHEYGLIGEKKVSRLKRVIQYKVSKGPKAGWVTLAAQIVSSVPQKGTMDFTLMGFGGDMHRTGEIRNIKTSGAEAIAAQYKKEGQPPGAAAMLENAFRATIEAFTPAIFWFPEFPEDGLEIGDEFEVRERISQGGPTPYEAKTVAKHVFTLEDISEGLAYFSVRERSLTEMDGVMGGKAETKTAGKADAIFDLQQGMWSEVTTKTKITVKLGNIAGMGSSTSKQLYIKKVTMERE